MSKKTFKGKVVSTKMKKTVVVTFEMPKKHAIYGKALKNTRRIKAHDDIGLKVNDEVLIEESRPYSKQVAFNVLKKLEKAKK